MYAGNGLLPTRFLTLVAHLCIAASILLAREENVKASLPLEYGQDQYKAKDFELMVGLSVALGLGGLEIFGLLSGISMFMPTVALISIASHCSASVALAYFVVDAWDCNSFWWVFGFGSAIPGAVEFLVILGAILFR